MNVQIGEMGIDELPSAARLHCEAFPGTLLSMSGYATVQLFLRHFIQSRQGIILSAKCDGKLAGYVCGAIDRSGFLKSMVFANCLRFVPLLVWSVIRNPKLIGMIFVRLKSVMRSEEKTKQTWGLSELPSANLMSIAVDSNYRGGGIGGRLNLAFLREIQERGYTQAMLGVRKDNLAALRSYEKVGWKIVQQNEGGVIMTIDITESEIHHRLADC